MKYTLFVTPFLPYPTGGGSTMRASVILEVLASLGPVIVVNPTIFGHEGSLIMDDWARSRAAAFFRVPIERVGEIKSLVADFLSSQPGATLDIVYAFRQQVAPAALSCLSLAEHGLRATFLDLDDDDTNRNEQFVPLYEAAGAPARASELRSTLHRMNLFRQVLMGKFQHLLLASPDDCRSMGARYPQHTFLHLPNVVREPAAAATAVARDSTRLLFVGTLSYLPNEDGVVMFVREILPRIRAVDDRIGFRVVGMGWSDAVRSVAELPGVRVVGAVVDLTPEYAAASMLVVPIRAGSGTRIKILEAFSHRIPVVSTTKGAEGLAVTAGKHLLIADTPEEFARCCLRLAGDDALREQLVELAHDWVVREHSVDTVRRVIYGCLGIPDNSLLHTP